MAYKTIKATWLIEKFKTMVEPGKEWRYVANGTEKGAVDCSGAFTYWYKQGGSYMYHGSNTMWRKYSTEKGKIGEITLVPGMAVFKMKRDGTEPSAYKNDGMGNFYHVGLYIGNNQVVEAKGTRYGCVISKLSDWGYAARLKYTDYEDNNVNQDSNPDAEQTTNENVTFYQKGQVTGGSLNLRSSPVQSSTRLKSIPNGTIISILSENGAWYRTAYGGQTGYVMKKYVKLLLSVWKITGTVTDESDVDQLIQYASSLGITLTKTLESGDAT